MNSGIIKIIIGFIVIVVIFGYSTYTSLITNLGTAINGLNSNFIAFLPFQIKIVLTIIVLGVLIAIIYKFID